jgi:hypothetical protein
MTMDEISEVPGASGWSYGAFHHDEDAEMTSVPLVRESDGRTATFQLPDFMHVPQDIADVARIVIRAVERSEDSEGLGA